MLYIHISTPPPPCSLTCGIADVKTSLELVEDCFRKTLGYDVSILQICGHMNDM
jgi:hypothetical protein